MPCCTPILSTTVVIAVAHEKDMIYLLVIIEGFRD